MEGLSKFSAKRFIRYSPIDIQFIFMQIAVISCRYFCYNSLRLSGICHSYFVRATYYNFSACQAVDVVSLWNYDEAIFILYLFLYQCILLLFIWYAMKLILNSLWPTRGRVCWMLFWRRTIILHDYHYWPTRWWRNGASELIAFTYHPVRISSRDLLEEQLHWEKCYTIFKCYWSSHQC